jgi:hypothetical protein
VPDDHTVINGPTRRRFLVEIAADDRGLVLEVW